MKLYINANSYTEKQKQEAEETCAILKQAGHVLSASPEEAELIVSLGGDGALLKSAQLALNADRPLVGINSGRLGFLCLMKQEEIREFDQILDHAKVTRRTVLKCTVQEVTTLALNDVVVSKPNFGETVDLHLYAGRYEYDMRGDGLLIATPTGSTAYNSSAGGPVVDYEAPVFTITPICASGDFSPIILRDDREITVSVNHGRAHVYADGKRIAETGDSVLVRTAEQTLTLIV